MSNFKNLKEQYKFHFNLPPFLKEFLHNISLKPTFKNRLDKHLEAVEEKYKDFVSKNRWLLFDYELPFNYELITNGELNEINFGIIGRYQYDNILYFHINVKWTIFRMYSGYCWNLRCENPALKEIKVPKHSYDLVDKLFQDYHEWKKNIEIK